MLAELIKQSFGEIGVIERSPLSPNRSLSLFVALAGRIGLAKPAIRLLLRAITRCRSVIYDFTLD